MIYLPTYIAKSCICPGNKKAIKYDVVRIIIEAPKLQKVFISLEMFLLNNIAPECCSNMMHVSQGTILQGEFQLCNLFKNQESPGKALTCTKPEQFPVEAIFFA